MSNLYLYRFIRRLLPGRLLTLVAACCCVALSLAAQTPSNCIDIVYLYDGSQYIGNLTGAPTDSVELRVVSGEYTMTFTKGQIRKIVQRCKGIGNKDGRAHTFREKGLYHATRLAVLTGRTWGNNPITGFGLYHATGYAFRRELGIGMGGGVDYFVPSNEETATYPVFAEIRGYLRPANATPFYALGLGWGFTERESGEEGRFNRLYRWQGGAALQAEIGYRFGNHFMALASLRLQQKTRTWQAWDESSSIQRIWYRRLGLGIGFLF